MVGVLELHAGQQDGAEDRVLRLHKVDVAGRDDRFVQVFADPDNRLVELHQLGAALRLPRFQHKFVVADRLDLEVVVKAGDFTQLLERLAVDDRPEELPRLAGGTDQQPFPVLHDLALGGAGAAVEVFDVGAGNQFIEVFEPDAVFDQQDLVVGLQLFGVAAPQVGVQLPDKVDVFLRFQLFDHLLEDLAEDGGVVAGTVMVEVLQFEVLGNDVQLVPPEFRVEAAGHRQGVDRGVGDINAVAVCRRPDKGHVERGVVGDQRPVPGESEELPEGFLLLRGVLHHLVGDAGEFGDFRRDWALGVDEDIERLLDFSTRNPHRADFGQTVGPGV